MSTTKPKVRLKIGAKLLMYIFAILFLIALSSFLLLTGLRIVTVHSITYNEDSNIDYNICLVRNNYFEDRCLAKDKQYIASLIDYIDAKFVYTFHASDIFDYTYKYWITAEVIATERDNETRVIYRNIDTLLEEKEFERTDSNSFAINENININYREYNYFMTNFRREHALSLDANLIITLHIELDGVHRNLSEPIESRENMKIIIPLSEQTLDITASYVDVRDSQIIEESSIFEPLNILYYVASILILVINILLLINFIRFLNKIKKPRTEYEKTVARLLREYDQLIVESRNIPIMDNLNVIDVEQFEELLDARETIQKPILHIETKTGKKTWFVILTSTEAYRYILDAKKLESKKE